MRQELPRVQYLCQGRQIYIRQTVPGVYALRFRVPENCHKDRLFRKMEGQRRVFFYAADPTRAAHKARQLLQKGLRQVFRKHRRAIEKLR